MASTANGWERMANRGFPAAQWLATRLVGHKVSWTLKMSGEPIECTSGRCALLICRAGLDAIPGMVESLDGPCAPIRHARASASGVGQQLMAERGRTPHHPGVGWMKAAT